MAKKRISSVDLIWLISEEMFDPVSRAARMALAVVPDDKHGCGRSLLPAATKVL